MKVTLRLWMILTALVPCAAAQLAPSPSALRYDTGTFANGVYTNECMGFSIATPPGWELIKQEGDTDTTRIGTHMPDGSIHLLTIDRSGVPPLTNRLVIIVQNGNRFNGTVQDLVTRAVHGFVDADPIRYELLRDAFLVEYGGRQFYRGDYKQNLRNGGAMYLSNLFTSVRGYFLGAILMTQSAAALDQAADLLQHISFAADQVNPACIVGDNSQTGRMVGVIGSVVGGAPKNGVATRVRVSTMVANGLLIKKVDPQYPEDARKAGVQGVVKLQVIISKEGYVEPNVTVVAGDPKLVPAALDAVKNWRFKPYLLNGQPVEIDTVLAITFDPLAPTQ